MFPRKFWRRGEEVDTFKEGSLFCARGEGIPLEDAKLGEGESS